MLIEFKPLVLLRQVGPYIRAQRCLSDLGDTGKGPLFRSTLSISQLYSKLVQLEFTSFFLVIMSILRESKKEH